MQSLCESCSHLREVVSRKGSRFLLCQLSQVDKRFPKYPPQPVGSCAGYQDKSLAVDGFRLEVLPGAFVVCQLPAKADVPDWANGELVSITRTNEELSIVCSSENVPQEIQQETGWRALRVAGPLDFSMVGVIATLTAALAAANISVFTISTFNTDYLLVKESNLDAAIKTLRAAGHTVA